MQELAQTDEMTGFLTKTATQRRIETLLSQSPDRAWAENKAQELLSSLYRLHIDEGRCWQIAASIGVALSPSDGAEYATLYKKADQALYRTKARGKNGVSFAGIADDNMLPL